MVTHDDAPREPVGNEKSARDRNGAVVSAGDLVRVIEIPRDIFLDAEDTPFVNSMLGEVFEVEGIDAWGCAEVTKWWDVGEGQSMCHGLALSSHEMELGERRKHEV